MTFVRRHIRDLLYKLMKPAPSGSADPQRGLQRALCAGRATGPATAVNLLPLPAISQRRLANTLPARQSPSPCESATGSFQRRFANSRPTRQTAPPARTSALHRSLMLLDFGLVIHQSPQQTSPARVPYGLGTAETALTLPSPGIWTTHISPLRRCVR